MTSRSGLTALLVISIIFVLLGAFLAYRILLAIEAQIAARLFNSYANEDNNLELKVEDDTSEGKRNGNGSAASSSSSSSSSVNGGMSVDIASELDAGSNYYASVNDHGGPSASSSSSNDNNNSEKSDTNNNNNNNNNSTSSSTSSSSSHPSIARISTFNKSILAFLTSLLVLLAYLLLVLSNAPPLLARLGLLLSACLVLQRQILHEVRNEGDTFDFSSNNYPAEHQSCLGRGRYDRLALLTGALMVVTSAMNFGTYASRTVAEEDVYVGPARIVGYDAGSYSVVEDAYDSESSTTQMEESTVTSQRTDLEVAWGNGWGCPHMKGVECRADLEGALCEIQDDVQVEELDSTYGVGEEEESRTHEVYYDSNGEKVVTNAEDTVDTVDTVDIDKTKKKGKKGNNEGVVIDEYASEETTRYGSNGDMDSYHADESETEYDSDTGNKDYEMAEERSVDYTASGDVDTSEYVLTENTYNGTDGVLVESMTEEEVAYGVEGGGEEDTMEYLDATYDDNGETEGEVGQLEDETYDISMTETNAEGQILSEFNEDYTMEEKDGVFEEAILSESSIQAEYDENGNKKEETINDEWYEEGSDLSITEEFINEEEITYDEDVDGELEHEEISSEAMWTTTNGGTEYDTDHETIDYSAENGYASYNATSEEIVYDEDGNIVKNVTAEYGDRYLRRARNLGTVRRRWVEDETEREEENEELEEENEELKKENEQLKEELKYEEEEVEDVYDEEINDDDDDWAEEADWNNVWGDYNCYNLFDADLDHGSYDAATPAGEDDWPYLNIYGNCRTCEAYVVDRFSTDYFLGDVRAYRTAGRNDAIAAILTLGVALMLAIRRRMLVRNDGGGGGVDNKSVNFLEEEARSRNGGSFAQGSGPRIMID